MTNQAPITILSNSTEYIPYSTRHNITDKDLAGLLDYLERVMGWEITEIGAYDDIEWSYSVNNHVIELWSDDEILLHVGLKNPIRNHKELFFRTYSTLLPVIRDLYSK